MADTWLFNAGKPCCGKSTPKGCICTAAEVQGTTIYGTITNQDGTTTHTDAMLWKQSTVGAVGWTSSSFNQATGTGDDFQCNIGGDSFSLTHNGGILVVQNASLTSWSCRPLLLVYENLPGAFVPSKVVITE